jgi:predicted nucleic acid-binding protein
MILCDTGFIVGTINSGDKHHLKCRATLSRLKQRMVTTQACITESMYLIKDRAGWTGQQTVIEWIEAGFLTIHPSRPDIEKRACALMRRYADAPMDYADATLVAAAEDLNIRRILTFDKHFYAYQINDIAPFEVMP